MKKETKRNVVVREIYMENTKPGHNKFYQITQNGLNVTIRYGRIERRDYGCVSDTYDFENEYKAEEFANSKARQKLMNRDYEVIRVDNFDTPEVAAKRLLSDESNIG
jgi:predicted DNA-binding WGR domain protein